MSDIAIKLPDGSERTLDDGATGTDLAASIGKRLAKDALVVEVNGQPVDLNTRLHDGDAVRIVTIKDAAALEHLRHSTAHVLAQAVLALWPGATFAGGPAIEDGFYYDFELPGGDTFSDDDLGRIEDKMRSIIAANQPFERFELPVDEARELMAEHPYKRTFMDLAAEASAGGAAGSGGDTVADELAADVVAGADISFYRNTPSFVDMCRGPHVPSTGRLGHFKLMRVAGAYFRGSEKNPMLQRIYGTAWATDAQLKEHLHRLEEAQKRDHRRLGVELDLFSFPDEVGSGLAVFHPKGGIIRRLMEDYSRERHEDAGYEFVYSPHITKAELFEKSGHLQWYADGMYPPMELDHHDHGEDGEGAGGTGTKYYLKPMNCPFHILIYRSRTRSYRDLPLRMFEFGTVYRYEKSGVVHGLTRARGFAQDDAHIFTTKEHMADEISSLLDFVLDLLRDYGLDDFYLELSTKPDEKSIGSDEEWEEATEALRVAASSKDLELVLDPGGGAFYAPKISVQARDAIGRSWQMSTIQVDLMLPQRFDLSYIGADGDKHRPVMIHRALFGSVERFFAVLLEHYAGAFPAWLAPLQARVLPVADAHAEYAAEVESELRRAGFRVDTVAADETLGNRIRRAKGEKLPYVLVVGDDDVANRTVGVNPRAVEGQRGEVERDVSLTDFVARLASDVDTKR